MGIKQTIAWLGTLLMLAAIAAMLLTVSVIFLAGIAWVSDRIWPYVASLSILTLVVVILILLPMAIPRTTRALSSIGLLFASSVFGITLLMYSLLVAWTIWGLTAVVVGMVFVGIGVVPISMLAALLHGEWRTVIAIIMLITATIGCQSGAFKLAESVES